MRIQILDLPAQGDFALVIDRVTDEEHEELCDSGGALSVFKGMCGARGLLVWPGEVEIG